MSGGRAGSNVEFSPVCCAQEYEMNGTAHAAMDVRNLIVTTRVQE